jgi:hypothetical protein
MAKREPKPLTEFPFQVVQQPLFGLLRNIDGDLRRLIEKAALAKNIDDLRNLTLLLVMMRFASNSYDAICFLLSDMDGSPKRLPRFVLIVPPVNRQIMDLWFTLVYMMDDFGPRALAYEQCGWREIGEEVSKFRLRYGTDPDWQPWFEDMQELMTMMEVQIPITAAQKANPKAHTLLAGSIQADTESWQLPTIFGVSGTTSIRRYFRRSTPKTGRSQCGCWISSREHCTRRATAANRKSKYSPV